MLNISKTAFSLEYILLAPFNFTHVFMHFLWFIQKFARDTFQGGWYKDECWSPNTWDKTLRVYGGDSPLEQTPRVHRGGAQDVGLA